jgi:transcriptional regulator with XRE-family HTH domain
MPRRRRLPDELGLVRGVGSRLIEIRNKVRLTQENFVERLGKGTQRALAHYERGEILPPADFIFLVCETFNVNFTWLMSGVGPQGRTDLLKAASVGRSEEDADLLLKKTQDLVFNYAFSRDPIPYNQRLDPISSSLRMALSSFERSFARYKGPIQFADFLEAFLHNIRELMGRFLDQMHVEELGRQESALRDKLRQGGIAEFGLHPLSGQWEENNPKGQDHTNPTPKATSGRRSEVRQVSSKPLSYPKPKKDKS